MEIKKVFYSLLNLDEYLTNCVLYPFNFCPNKFRRKPINIASKKCFLSLDDHHRHSKNSSVCARWLMRGFVIWATSKFKVSVWFPIGYFSFGLLVSFYNKGVTKKVQRPPPKKITRKPVINLIIKSKNQFDQRWDELKREMLENKVNVGVFWKDLTGLVEEKDFVDRIFKEVFTFYFNLCDESKFDNHLDFFLSNLNIDDRESEKIASSIKTIRNEMVQELKRPRSDDILHGYESVSLNNCLHRNIPKKYWPFPFAKTFDKKNKNTFVCYIAMVVAIYHLTQQPSYYLKENHKIFSPLDKEERDGKVYSYPFKLLLENFMSQMSNPTDDFFKNSQYYSYIAQGVPNTIIESSDVNDDSSTYSLNDDLKYVLDEN